MAKKNAKIVVVDDDKDVLIAAELLLKRHYSEVSCYSHPQKLLDACPQLRGDVFLLDMNFALGRNTGEEGLAWLKRIQEIKPGAVVVMMTAYGDVETSVAAIKNGAADFVLKPWQNEKLLATLNSALLLADSREQVQKLKQQRRELQQQNKAIIAEAPLMKQVLKLAQRAALTDVNVLILGENGAGKEVIAQEIHRHSARKDELMLSVDLGAIPESLFESELFGHVKGAFTDANSDRAGRFQAASGGTLFLDEIGNLPLHLQAKLLRVLESREVSPVGSDKHIAVDVRLICATNMPLQTLVDEGKFRADLFYRINTVQLELPPLRERPSDIPLLLDFYIQKSAAKYKLAHKSLSAAAIKKLSAYAWPGNVRELAHAVERALILSEGDELSEHDFLLRPQGGGSTALFDNCNLEHVERLAIEQALKKHAGNISHAAEELGITRTSLYRRLKKYGL
ncbi:sigma-54-dependent transcriptional regulator [Agaribacterium haliotis]|uniref:sigma-54-dependent transcriptional regulator n=1 Tax=Agaribacterium haliotis TaxID=2013869 RepID=UPI000BB5574F|nr:sigma-54 dependent transcriptional regulator [Agaribacterium haliotis]